jgi:hypothetical protein
VLNFNGSPTRYCERHREEDEEEVRTLHSKKVGDRCEIPTYVGLPRNSNIAAAGVKRVKRANIDARHKNNQCAIRDLKPLENISQH